MEVFAEKGINAAKAYSLRHNLNLENDKTLIEIWSPGGFKSSNLAEELATKYTLEIESQSEHFMLIRVPVALMENLANDAGKTFFLRRPSRIIPDVISEGVELIGARPFLEGNVHGRGIKVAVIDIGFLDYFDLWQMNEMPEDPVIVNYTEEQIDRGSAHGSAVCEIIYDMLPEAEYHLIKIDDDADYENAVEYAIEEEIDIISMSLSWFLPFNSYYDADDQYCRIADQAADAGILFVKSAGNYATQHYRADFDDQDAEDGYHRFSDDVTVNHFGDGPDNYFIIAANNDITVTLAWDDFPETDQDYDLELVFWNEDEGEWVLVTDSALRQQGDEPPIEVIEFTVENRGNYGVRVLGFDAENDCDFTLFSTLDLAYRTPEGSLGIPAMAEGIMAVGAVHYNGWDNDDVEQEWFSSQGPTYDGRIKPDITAPDGVSTLSYGNRRFFGTSASAPHLAGAAGLVLCYEGDMTLEELREYLAEHAVDAGDEGMDNIFGHGRLHIEMGGAHGEHVINVPEDFRTIQAAINEVPEGDTILVHPGVYVEAIDFGGNDFVLGSLYLTTGDLAYIDSTVIDGDERSVVNFERGESEQAELAGFTLINGRGVRIDLSSPTVHHCTITGNIHGNYSGGFMIDQGNPIIYDCLIFENGARDHGGGIQLGRSSPVISNCIIRDNNANNGGGGISIWQDSFPVFSNCIISGNSARSGGGGIAANGSEPVFDHCLIYDNEVRRDGGGGGGVYVHEGSIILINCTISGNTATTGGAVRCYVDGNAEVYSSILWGNDPQEVSFSDYRDANSLTIAYSDIEGGEDAIETLDNGEINWGDGNIDDDPLFVNPDDDDYHLSWENYPDVDETRSPCIDAADPDLPEDPDETRADMGIYPYFQGAVEREFVLRLFRGWNLVSINCTPVQEYWEREEGPDVLLMFDQLYFENDQGERLQAIELMKDEGGYFWAPDWFNFINIPYWNLEQGYQVKIRRDLEDEFVEARWMGTPIPPGRDIHIDPGWHIIPYYPTYELDPNHPDYYALQSIIEHVGIFKDGWGNFLVPGWDIPIPHLCQGQGYQIRIDFDEQVILNYPPSQQEGFHQSAGLPSPVLNPTPFHWSTPSITGSNMSVLLQVSPDLLGCEIAAINTDGMTAGTGIINSEGLCGMAVWGDDATTEPIDGLVHNEVFELKLWDGLSESNLETTEILTGEGLIYTDNGLTVLMVDAPGSAIPLEFHLSAVYPNPFNATVNIRYQMPSEEPLRIAVYDLSGREVAVLKDGMETAGYHHVSWQTDNQTSGVYLCRMETGEFKQTSKLILVK